MYDFRVTMKVLSLLELLNGGFLAVEVTCYTSILPLR
jgi:hypothetical protein